MYNMEHQLGLLALYLVCEETLRDSHRGQRAACTIMHPLDGPNAAGLPKTGCDQGHRVLERQHAFDVGRGADPLENIMFESKKGISRSKWE
jgi:hypothetical protein